MMRPMVLLPQPEGPITHSSSRRYTLKESCSSALTGPSSPSNTRQMPSTSSTTGRA